MACFPRSGGGMEIKKRTNLFFYSLLFLTSTSTDDIVSVPGGGLRAPLGELRPAPASALLIYCWLLFTGAGGATKSWLWRFQPPTPPPAVLAVARSRKNSSILVSQTVQNSGWSPPKEALSKGERGIAPPPRLCFLELQIQYFSIRQIQNSTSTFHKSTYV